MMMGGQRIKSITGDYRFSPSVFKKRAMILKKLKSFLYEFDEDKKELVLTFYPDGISDGIVFTMDKTRMFSLFRFMIRVSQRLSTKHK